MFFENMEEPIRILHAEFSQLLKPEENKWIINYLDHNEWGLAFDDLVLSLIHGKVSLTNVQYARFKSIGEKMEMDSAIWEPLQSQMTE